VSITFYSTSLLSCFSLASLSVSLHLNPLSSSYSFLIFWMKLFYLLCWSVFTLSMRLSFYLSLLSKRSFSVYNCRLSLLTASTFLRDSCLATESYLLTERSFALIYESSFERDSFSLVIWSSSCFCVDCNFSMVLDLSESCLLRSLT